MFLSLFKIPLMANEFNRPKLSKPPNIQLELVLFNAVDIYSFLFLYIGKEITRIDSC